ncbi:FecR domain-containing protein [Chitinophaga sancti]|uniref:FecR domain-containing protein n=2 Tax=Chitinophaga sancti TaxID=1004 RepID=A0A1K1PHH7_9BACT|nr:FecR domain-containing protein [Chitinophaga sancti]WQD59424.1 FecR domain-containing protein [Chitinophaga sancti]WQG88442.1 FecR domain-containing protein [Chitinophaga sancti]SFW47258.1 FecR family protein [Chitinophaga sancti]
MLTPDEALYTLLCKYLLNEADSNEQQWVNTWLRANPEHPVLLASLDKLLRTAAEQAVQGAMDTETAWRLLSSRIDEGMGGRAGIGIYEVGESNEAGVFEKEGELDEERELDELRDLNEEGDLNDVGYFNERDERLVHKGANRSFKLTRWLAAASILLLISAVLWFFIHQSERQINYNGAQLVKLDDGSSVRLDPAAQLQVLPGFGKKNRKVILKGKAEFDVTTDAAHPFIIDLGNQAITVLGTRFSVDNSHQLRVFINSGKIKVSRERDSVILTAGMLLEEDSSKQQYQVGAHIKDAATQAIVFKDTPLREVLQTINVLYHVNVSADADLMGLPVTANYTGESVQNVLEGIAYLSNANVIIKGDDYELRRQE